MKEIPELVWECDDKDTDWGENTDSDHHRRWFVEHYIVQTMFIARKACQIYKIFVTCHAVSSRSPLS